MIRYRVGYGGSERWSRVLTDDRAIQDAMDRARKAGPDFRTKLRGDRSFSRKFNAQELRANLDRRVPKLDWGDVLFIDTAGSRRIDIRAIHIKPKLIDTSGNRVIDQIHTRLVAKFENWESWGICNCRVIDGTSSWSQHAYCNAEDVHSTYDRMQAIAQFLTRSKLPVAEVIYYRRIWTPGSGWHSYGGVNPHTDHVHISGLPLGTGTPACA